MPSTELHEAFDYDDRGEHKAAGKKCHKKNRCKSRLINLCLISLVLLCLALATLYILSFFKEEPCLSEGCVRLAASLLGALDERVAPCEDFYEFACGNWVRSHPIPDDRATVSNFEQPTIDLEYALKQLLSNTTRSGHRSIETARRFYVSCEDDVALARSWRSALDDALRSMGGWPVGQRSSTQHPPVPPADPQVERERLARLYGQLSLNFSQDSLFKFSVGADDRNSSNQVFQLDQATLTLSVREFYLLDEGAEEREAYYELMAESVVYLYGRDPVAVRQNMKEVMQFEIDLANITRDESRHDVETTYVKVKLNQLQFLTNNFNWDAFLTSVYPGVKWSPDTEIVVYCLEFLEDLHDLLARYSERVVRNYLIWRWFYNEVLQHLPEPYFTANFKFQRALQNLKVPQLRWHGCIRQVNQLMLHATGAMYVEKYFNPAAKKRAVEMIEMIKEAFHESIEENEWLSWETKLVASEKIDAMILKTGYPDFILNYTAVDDYYQNFTDFPGDFLRTKFRFEYLTNKKHYDRIFEPVDRNRWTSGSAVVNAFYSPNTNEIMFPAGILQPVFYSEAYPYSMNFGGIGVVIGHEITHGFDDKGRQYDKDGNIREWWDNATITKFEEKAMCIEDQYSRYYVDQVKLNISGRNTKGENIADNGGLRHAFKAYKKWSAINKESYRLPGLKYTHDQLFFINYAQIWCGSMNDKEFVRKIKTSVHSPGVIRVKGPLRNLNEFSEAFQCPVGSPMNPEPAKKCRIW